MGIHIHSKLIELLTNEITALGFDCAGIAQGQEGKAQVLRVYIDKLEGITLDDCVAVTRQLSRVLDVEEPTAGKYRLEVSSPGLDRPLFTPAHYRRFVGQTVKLKTHTPIQGQKHFVGILSEVSDTGIVLSVASPGEPVSIAFSDIDKANLVPTY